MPVEQKSDVLVLRRLERAEADERRMAAAEDEYSWKVVETIFCMY